MGSLGFLPDFDFCMAVLGFGRCTIGLAAPWRVKTVDSQAETSDMGPAPTEIMNCVI